MRSERPADSTAGRWAARAFRYLRTAAVVTAWFAVPLSGAGAAEPTGIGEARFGMSVAAVRKLYPQLAPATGSLGAPVASGTDIARHVLRDTADLDLPKPVDAELRFYKDRLWMVIVYLRDNDPAAALAALTDRLGAPKTGPDGSSWKGKAVTAVLLNRPKYYTYTDNPLSKEMKDAFVAALTKARREGQTTPLDFLHKSDAVPILPGTPTPAP